jgi:prevent-host-death family protein
MANKNINVNELQSQISKVLKDVQAGEVYEVMRYSEPIAVVVSYEKYLTSKGECKRCIEDLRKLVKEEAK